MQTLQADTERDFYLTSQDAVEYGIVDSVMRRGN